MAFLTGKKKSTGTYRGVKVPITLKALLMLEDRLSKCDMSKRMDFTCSLVCRVYEDITGTSESKSSPLPNMRRTQWGKFLFNLKVIPGESDAMLEGTIPDWVRDLAPVGATLNQIRLALVRDILKEAHNHA